jgi:hypothetical protein
MASLACSDAGISFPIYNANLEDITCNFDGAEINNAFHATVKAGDTIVASYNAAEFTLAEVDKAIVLFLFLSPLSLTQF